MFRDQLHYLNYKDNLLRVKNTSNELENCVLKMFLSDLRINYNLKFILKNKFLTVKFFYTTKNRNRCLVVGKSRFVFSYFRLNRSSLKHFSSFGFISGFQKK